MPNLVRNFVEASADIMLTSNDNHPVYNLIIVKPRFMTPQNFTEMQMHLKGWYLIAL